MNNIRMSDLNVMISVSFCWPHVVPERAFRMFSRESGACDECLDVWGECKVSVKGDSKDSGCAVEG